MCVGLFLGSLFCSIDPLCLFLCQYHTVLITVALSYSLKSERVIPPAALFFFLKITLAIQGLLWFHINFMIIYSSSVKNVMGILIGIVLNLYRLLWVVWTFLKFYLFIYLWLRWVFVVAHRLSLVVASGGYSSWR